MIRIKNTFAGITILILTMGFVQMNEWYLFDSKTFSIYFPKKPESSTQNMKTEIGEIKMDIFMYDASDEESDNLIYGLITSEYPDSIINSGKIEILSTFFRNSIDGAVKNVQGKLLSEKILEIEGFPGREIKVDYRNGLAIIKMRIYLIKNKMIISQTITEPRKDENEDVLKFHNSFKLKNNY